MNFRVEARGAGTLDENKRSGSERGKRGECGLRRMAGVGLEIVEERHDIGRVGEKSGRREWKKKRVEGFKCGPYCCSGVPEQTPTLVEHWSGDIGIQKCLTEKPKKSENPFGKVCVDE